MAQFSQAQSTIRSLLVVIVRNLTDDNTKQLHSLDPEFQLGSNSALFRIGCFIYDDNTTYKPGVYRYG